MFALLGLLVRVLLRLFRELAHVIVHRLAKLLHELGDFLVGRAVLHRLRETLLRPAEPLERIREIALLHEKRDVPQDRRHFVAGLFGQRAVIRRRLEAADQDAELEVGRLLGEHLLGLVGDRPQHRGHPGGIVARPQKVAALFDDGLRERVEEPPAGHLLFDRAGRAHLLFSVHREKLDGDREACERDARRDPRTSTSENSARSPAIGIGRSSTIGSRGSGSAARP